MFTENIIIKLLYKLDFYKQTILTSMIFSLSFTNLIFDIMGKEDSIDFILKYTSNYSVLFAFIAFLSLFSSKYFIYYFKKQESFLLAHFINFFLSSNAVFLFILSFYNSQELVSDWTEGTMPYLTVSTLFSLYYMYKILFVVKISNKKNNN